MEKSPAIAAIAILAAAIFSFGCVLPENGNGAANQTTFSPQFPAPAWPQTVEIVQGTVFAAKGTSIGVVSVKKDYAMIAVFANGTETKIETKPGWSGRVGGFNARFVSTYIDPVPRFYPSSSQSSVTFELTPA